MASSGNLSGPSRAEEQEVKRYIEKNGIEKLSEYVTNKLDQWKGQPINVAVTGSVGVGKSSFINTIRGLTARDKGAAKVGVTETTREVKKYYHPKNSSFVLWDLPGCGTRDFPKQSYLSRVGVDRYDFFLIFACRHFTENDVWLVNEIADRGKSFALIRTMIDRSIEDDERDNPNFRNAEEVITRVKNDIRTQLKQSGVKSPKVFTINNRSNFAFDFPALDSYLFERLPGVKQKAWRMTLRSLSIDAIREKRLMLKMDAWQAALECAAFSVVPIPGLNCAVSIANLTRHVNRYIKEFELDDKSLEYLSSITNKSIRELRELTKHVAIILVAGIGGMIAELASGQVAQQSLSCLPILGSVIAGKMAYDISLRVLNKVIDKCEEDAIRLLKAVTAA